MKTRVITLSVNEYVPQVWVPHFLWGGHWEGISLDEEGNFWRFEGLKGQYDRCTVSTHKEAEDITVSFLKWEQKKEKLV